MVAVMILFRDDILIPFPKERKITEMSVENFLFLFPAGYDPRVSLPPPPQPLILFLTEIVLRHIL